MTLNGILVAVTVALMCHMVPSYGSESAPLPDPRPNRVRARKVSPPRSTPPTLGS